MKQVYIDRAGILTSLICAVHCLILPVALSAGILTGWSWMRTHYVDYFFITLAAIFAFWAFRKAFQHHHNRLPMVIAGIGFVFMFSGLLLGHGTSMEWILMGTGGLLLASAHAYNIKLSRQCVHCTHE